MSADFYLRNLWRWACDRPEREMRLPPLSELAATQWSPEFEQFMRNRLIQGAFRYGDMRRPHAKYDRITSIMNRVDAYRETRNKEMLVDIANLALLEFVQGDGIWSPTEDTQKAGEI